MFAGHMGAGLALGSAARDINVGVFVAAALLPDFLLWLFVLLGWESVAIPADFARHHQPGFVFPYSHGLLPSVVWSAVAAGVTLIVYPGPRRVRAGALIGVAVLSHWVLDAVVHRPELPLTGWIHIASVSPCGTTCRLRSLWRARSSLSGCMCSRSVSGHAVTGRSHSGC